MVRPGPRRRERRDANLRSGDIAGAGGGVEASALPATHGSSESSRTSLHFRERLDGRGVEGHCEGARERAARSKSLMHSPHRIGNVNRMHRRSQVSRSDTVTRPAISSGIETEAPHGASRLTEAGGRDDVRATGTVHTSAVERRKRNGRLRGQTTSARPGAAAAGR
jgi:hypothetical protein